MAYRAEQTRTYFGEAAFNDWAWRIPFLKKSYHSMTLPPAAAVITRLKFGGMRAAMVILPARSWRHIAADEHLYDFVG